MLFGGKKEAYFPSRPSLICLVPELTALDSRRQSAQIQFPFHTSLTSHFTAVLQKQSCLTDVYFTELLANFSRIAIHALCT